MRLIAALQPAPQAPVPGASLAGWIWLMIVLALVVAGGVLLGSRR